MGYNTKMVKNMESKAGGHGGIGNLTNIFGEVKPWDNAAGNFIGSRYLDLFKNKMIKDSTSQDFILLFFLLFK